MQFGVFDHLDRNDLPLGDYYESRLDIIEAYDRLGFYGYHIAEHHSTPLGLAPSPSVFLSAVAQRTQRLRFGPLVYALPLYHPLRMIEEICMLDQMSGGRLELGFGRGAVPAELIYYGQKPEEAQQVYAEAIELIRKGLTERTLTFHGRFFHFDSVPMELEPRQKPHPPIWYGVHAPESAQRAARQGLRVVSLDPVPATCARSRSPGAPIRNGIRASLISIACMAGAMPIRARRPSTGSPKSAKASPARPRPWQPSCASSWRKQAAIIVSANSPSAISHSPKRCIRSSCSRAT